MSSPQVALFPYGNSTNFVEIEQAISTIFVGMAKGTPQTVFGRRLREARLRADIPQDRLGVHIGLDETVASARISRYETGIHEPAFDTAVRLGQVLNVPAAYFYCESDELANFVLAWDSLRELERKEAWSFLDTLKLQRSES